MKNKTAPLHIMLIPGVIVTFLFAYLPLAGLTMAFQNFRPLLGFFESDFVGFNQFAYIFNIPGFWKAFGNTVIIAFFKIILNILVPLTLALLLNELSEKFLGRFFKRFVQTVVFIPFFFSWAILGGILLQLFDYTGPINNIIVSMGGERTAFLISNDFFRTLVIGSDVWKGMGYNTVIFLAAITNVDVGMYEAASVDGAGQLRKLWSITLPSIMPMVILLTILGLGNILNAGFDQILVLENPVVRRTVDIMDTFVYRLGIESQQYSPAAAAGLFKSVISMLFVGGSYLLAYKTTDYRVF